jgi:hypothetical protein
VTIILGIFAVVLILVLWTILGATYELIKCYQDDNFTLKLDITENNSHRENSMAGNSRNQSIESGTVKKDKTPKTDTEKCLIYFGIVCLGILIQPLYLAFKFLELLLECFRRYGCWFYYFGSY